MMFFFFDNEIQAANETLFESIKHIDEFGMEYWSARELMPALEYRQWRQFSDVVKKAMDACKTSNNSISDNFADVRKIVNTGVASKEIEDYYLSRYACYLIAMNGDPRKRAIALAQTYFAVKTRQQELAESYDELSEDQKRLVTRAQVVEHNKSLFEAAHNAGIKQGFEYARFQNYGYKGLYGGLTAKDIHKRKGLKPSQKILDHMGSTELAANLFRATQAAEKLRRDNVQGKDAANQVHYDVGSAVRKTIQELGGTMPEDLPTPGKSIRQIEQEQGKRILLHS